MKKPLPQRKWRVEMLGEGIMQDCELRGCKECETVLSASCGRLWW